MKRPSPLPGLLGALGWAGLAVVLTPIVLPPNLLYRTVVAGVSVVLFVLAIVAPVLAWIPALGAVAAAGVSSLLFGAPESAPAGLILAAAFLCGCSLRGIYDLEASGTAGPLLPEWRALVAGAAVSACAAFVWARTSYLLVRSVPLPRTVNVLGADARDVVFGAASSVAALAVVAGAHGYAWRASRAVRGRRILDVTLVVVALLSGGVAVAQRAGVLDYWRAARWASWNRGQGIFTDPPAAGVVAALLLAPVLARAATGPIALRLAAVAGAGGLVVLLTDAGSRAGFLGAVTSVLTLAAWSMTRLSSGTRPSFRRRIVRTAGALVVFTSLVFAGALAWPSGSGPHSALLSRLERTFSREPGPAEEGPERLVLYQAGFALFRDRPVTGIGLGVFRAEFPNAAQRLARRVGFSDHPPSLYLAVLCEMGLGGLLLAALLVAGLVTGVSRALSFNENGMEEALRTAAAAASLVGFAVVLLFGSHLVYPEIAVVVGVLCARLPADARGHGTRIFSSLLPVVLAGSLVLLGSGIAARWMESQGPETAFAWAASAGVHPAEPEAGGPPFRWTGTAAAFRMSADPGRRGRLVLPIRNARPDGEVVSLDLFWNDVARGAISLTWTGWKTLELPVEGSGVLRIVPSTSFRPVRRSDNRLLGIQVGPGPTLVPASGAP